MKIPIAPTAPGLATAKQAAGYSLHSFLGKDKVMVTEINEANARLILSENNLARLGCVLESGEPYIVPINYLYRDGAIYFHSMKGLKIAALRANPKASVLVNEIKNNFDWRSVIAFGEFEEITDASERREMLEIFLKNFPTLTPAEAVGSKTDARDEIVVFRINIRRITGRAES